MIPNTAHLQALKAPAREIQGKVELLRGSTNPYNFTAADALKSLTVTREAGKKFFGFGVSQKMTLELIDKERNYNIFKGDKLQPMFGVAGAWIVPHWARCSVSDIVRDENTNALTIEAADALTEAVAHTVAELNLSSYTIREFAEAAAALLGLSLELTGGVIDTWEISYSQGANFDGTESLRAALDAVAEATVSIYYVYRDKLVFRGLTASAVPDLEITKADYTTLQSKGEKRLAAVCVANELGDNIEATVAEEGITQYLRDNPFIELRREVLNIISAAIVANGGCNAAQYSGRWRGNYLLQIGDKITLTLKDGETITSCYLGGTFTYNGGIFEEISVDIEDNPKESAANPANLGARLKQTFARVDKANRTIELVASESAENAAELEAVAESISSLTLNTDSISASVSKTEREVAESLEALNDTVAELTRSVEAKATPEGVSVAIKKELESGAGKVVTSTGYILDDEGFRVEKTGSELNTTITDNGMIVRKNEEEMLVANAAGVDATNLNAKTYLIVGKYSRFEDYGSRTGCFWIGG